nr:helix-turn-helix domain-containing protein [Escherichia coli]
MAPGHAYPFFNNDTARGEIMEPYSLTLDEACQFLKISRPTATNWIRTGRLQATRKDPTKPKSPYLTTRQSGMATNRHAATSCLGESRREQIKPRHWCGAERYRL